VIHWCDAKLRQWGEWLQTGRGQGSRGLTANWEGVGGGGAAGAIIPIQSLDASLTHDWVQSRPEIEQVLLLQVYCTPHTMREHAAILKVSLRTMYSRLHQVHVAYASRTERTMPQPPTTRAAPPRKGRQSGNG
jgi:hypothetical protein